MNKRKVYNMASKKECKHSGPLVLQQAQYRAGVAELVLEDCVQGKFMMIFAKLSQAPVEKC